MCTENGAISLPTTGTAVLDFFFKVVRNTTPEQTRSMLKAAWEENPLLTLRAVFHLRDCRGGKGEKARFYDCVEWLVNNGHSTHIATNLASVVEVGSFKDLLIIGGDNPLELAVVSHFARSLSADIDALNIYKMAVYDNVVKEENGATLLSVMPPKISLAAKWAPTQGGALDKKYGYVKKIMRMINSVHKPLTASIDSPANYRKRLISPLRAVLRIVERDMCAGTWSDINFQSVPSVAMKTHRAAFKEHDGERFDKYLADVASGKAKINSAMVFPHQLVEHYLDGGELDQVIELQWSAIVSAAQRDFSAAGVKALPLVDVSGSMIGQPLQVAIALGLLISEIASGPFARSMLTFESNPQMFKVAGETLQEKVASVKAAPWAGGTNLARAFDMILSTAQTFSVKPENMPTMLYIFSDMQFDQASPSNDKTNFEDIEQKYASSGYVRPNVVFWNLRGDSLDFPVCQDVPRVALVSGFSQSLMKLFTSGDVISPMAVMLEALSSVRYQSITLS